MKFEIQQSYAASPDEVIARFCTEDFYRSLPHFERIRRPEFLDVKSATETEVTVRIRRRFSADLPAAARMVVDVDRLSWIDETRYDLVARTATTKMVPDHYASKLVASAASTFAGIGDQSCERVVRGDLRVRILMGASQVEAAIISGLGEYLGEEAAAFSEIVRDD